MQLSSISLAITRLGNYLLPALDLAFHTGVVDSRITFTRASGAMQVKADNTLELVGNGVPRISYDSTSGKMGLLIEEARTNLVTYSSEFDNAAWAKVRAAITVNATIAPDGTLTADKLVDSLDSSTHYLYTVGFSYTAGTSYTKSIYAKAAELTALAMTLPAGAFTTEQRVRFNLDAGSYDILTGTPVVVMTALGNGWYRCAISATATVTTGVNSIVAYLVSGGNTSYTGDGTSGIYIWGADLQAGAFPTSHIPTTTAAATRAADVALIDGVNFSSFYRQDEGTFVVDFSAFAPSYAATAHVFSTSTGVASELAGVFLSAALTSTAESYAGGALQASLSLGTSSANTPSKVAYAYKVNDFAAVRNAGTVATDVSGVVSAPNELRIGHRYGVARHVNGHIFSLRYYNTRLSNAHLQALSAL